MYVSYVLYGHCGAHNRHIAAAVEHRKISRSNSQSLPTKPVSIPTVVLLRDLKDREQQNHVDSLLPLIQEYVTVLTESNTDSQSLQQALEIKLYYAP
jgi:hypothetical protein